MSFNSFELTHTQRLSSPSGSGRSPAAKRFLVHFYHYTYVICPVYSHEKTTSQMYCVIIPLPSPPLEHGNLSPPWLKVEAVCLLPPLRSRPWHLETEHFSQFGYISTRTTDRIFLTALRTVSRAVNIAVNTTCRPRTSDRHFDTGLVTSCAVHCRPASRYRLSRRRSAGRIGNA